VSRHGVNTGSGNKRVGSGIGFKPELNVSFFQTRSLNTFIMKWRSTYMGPIKLCRRDTMSTMKKSKMFLYLFLVLLQKEKRRGNSANYIEG
jgi:hypothetical protein